MYRGRTYPISTASIFRRHKHDETLEVLKRSLVGNQSAARRTWQACYIQFAFEFIIQEKGNQRDFEKIIYATNVTILLQVKISRVNRAFLVYNITINERGIL